MRANRSAVYVVDCNCEQPTVKRIFLSIDFEESLSRAKRFCKKFERITKSQLELIEVELTPGETRVLVCESDPARRNDRLSRTRETQHPAPDR
jgi:hypothetical protein